jgi:hypothetical protein
MPRLPGCFWNSPVFRLIDSKGSACPEDSTMIRSYLRPVIRRVVSEMTAELVRCSRRKIFVTVPGGENWVNT